MTARSKWILRAVLIAFILEAVYVAAGNYLIRSGLLSQIVDRPNKTYLSYKDAWTLMPGLVHVEDFLLRDQDKNVQWSLAIEKATLSINLLALPFRRLNITKANAEGAKFRVKLQSSVAAKKPGLPDIEGFEGIPEPSETPPEHRFRFIINNLYVENLHEIWIDNHRFDGIAVANGSFYIWPKKEFEVRGANLDFKTGIVKTLNTTIANDIHGTAFAAIRLFPTQEKHGLEVFDYTSGLVAIQGRFGRADFLNVYLQKLNWIGFDEVEGDFRANVRVFDGIIGASSELNIKADRVSTELGGVKMKGSGSLNWYREENNLPAILDVKVGKYEFIDPKTQDLIMKGEGFGLRVLTREPRLRDMWNQVALHLELPPTGVENMPYFNRFIPAYSGIGIKSGSATLKGVLNVDSQGTADQSLAQLTATAVQIAIDKTSLRGDVRFDARMKDDEAGDKVFKIDGTKIRFENVYSDVRERAADRDGDWLALHTPWEGEISIDEGVLRPREEEVLDAKVSMKLIDLRPLLNIYSVRNKVAPWVRQILKVKNVEASARLSIGRDETVLRDLDMKSQGLEVKGWVRVENGKKTGALLTDLGLFKVGLELGSDGTKVITSKLKDWFEERREPPVADHD